MSDLIFCPLANTAKFNLLFRLLIEILPLPQSWPLFEWKFNIWLSNPRFIVLSWFLLMKIASIECQRMTRLVSFDDNDYQWTDLLQKIIEEYLHHHRFIDRHFDWGKRITKGLNLLSIVLDKHILFCCILFHSRWSRSLCSCLLASNILFRHPNPFFDVFMFSTS